ncbi:MAG: hypothetical protein ABIJ40_13250, partial [Bacteroidota bacterium]
IRKNSSLNYTSASHFYNFSGIDRGEGWEVFNRLNPASLSFVKFPAVNVSYLDDSREIEFNNISNKSNSESVTFVYPSKSLNIAFDYTRTSYRYFDIQNYSPYLSCIIVHDLLNSFDETFGITISKMLFDNFSFGLTFKRFAREIGNDKDNANRFYTSFFFNSDAALLADFGISYLLTDFYEGNEIGVGISVQNFGTEYNEYFRWEGVYYDPDLDQYYAEAQNYFDHIPQYLNAGIHYKKRVEHHEKEGSVTFRVDYRNYLNLIKTRPYPWTYINESDERDYWSISGEFNISGTYLTIGAISLPYQTDDWVKGEFKPVIACGANVPIFNTGLLLSADASVILIDHELQEKKFNLNISHILQ